MSQVYYSEQGNVVPTMCEELTRYRHARKILHLPGTREPARLFILARAYPGTKLPLRVTVNGTELPSIHPLSSDIYFWHELTISPEQLVTEVNVFEFWTDAHAMNAWSLGLEGGHRQPESFISDDGGYTWRNEKMGYLNVLHGEYIVRVRLAEGGDPPPPPMMWEDPGHPRLQQLCQMLPRLALEPGSTLERVRTLSTWVSTRWEYRNTSNAVQYAPWDPATIMAWGQSGRGHGGQVPVVMCVHYAVTLSMACLAAGIPARCCAFGGAANDFDGHFTSEVWFEEFQKWVLVDPNMDAILFKDDMPLSVSEIQQAGSDLADLIQWGPASPSQIKNPVIEPWAYKNYLKGTWIPHRSVWARMDFFSHPEFTPPGHGATAYCETKLVWEEKDLDEGFGMFPYFGHRDYFDAPPEHFLQSVAARRI